MNFLNIENENYDRYIPGKKWRNLSDKRPSEINNKILLQQSKSYKAKSIYFTSRLEMVRSIYTQLRQKT